jgi:hypothetical protein
VTGFVSGVCRSCENSRLFLTGPIRRSLLGLPVELYLIISRLVQDDVQLKICRGIRLRRGVRRKLSSIGTEIILKNLLYSGIEPAITNVMIYYTVIIHVYNYCAVPGC